MDGEIPYRIDRTDEAAGDRIETTIVCLKIRLTPLKMPE